GRPPEPDARLLPHGLGTGPVEGNVGPRQGSLDAPRPGLRDIHSPDDRSARRRDGVLPAGPGERVARAVLPARGRSGRDVTWRMPSSHGGCGALLTNNP